MKRTLLTLWMVLAAMSSIAQSWNPYVNQAITDPAPLLPWEFGGTGVLSFNVGNSGSDPLNLVINQEMSLVITLSNGEPDNADPLLALGGTWLSYFNWTYDAPNKTYIGIQNKDIPGTTPTFAAVGNIIIQYKVTKNSSSSQPSNGFNINIQPPDYTTGKQATGDDAASSYTYVRALDYGDAPASYGSAWHEINLFRDAGNTYYTNYVYLGASVDPESANQPSPNADGDDSGGSDDENGVTFPTLTPGSPAIIPVTFTIVDWDITSGSYRLTAWIDWNGDGDFLDTGERIYNSLLDYFDYLTNSGTINISVTVPASATTSPTYARFRFGSTVTSPFNDPAATSIPVGEVEDYVIVIGCTPPPAPAVGTITQPTCTTPTGSVALSGLPATGTWTLTRMPGGTTYSASGTSYTVTSLPPSTTYTFTVTSSDGCTSISSGSVVINAVPDGPALGGDSDVCAGLTATVTPGTGGTWTSSNTAIATVTNAGVVTGVSAGVVTLTFTRTSDGCSSSLIFTVYATPAAPTGTLAITNSTCTNCTLSGGSIALGTVSGIGGTLQLSTNNGTTWSTTLPVYDQDGPALTIHASVLSTNGCRSAMTLVGTTIPGVCTPANAGSDQMVDCNSTGTATMAATGTGTWSLGAGSAGTATITSPTSPTTTVTGFSAAGTYNLVWTASQGCTDIAVITVNNNCACPITNNTITQPSPASSCTPYAGTTIVGLAASPGGGTYLWEVNSGSGFVAALGTNNTQNYMTGALTAGTYTFQRKYTTTSGVICSTSSNNVTITVNATPAAPSGSLSITNSTCTNCTLSGGTIALGTVNGTGGTLQFSTDGGATWSSTLPTYDQDGPAQVIHASVLSANGCRSAMTLVGTTVPGVCTTPAAPTGTLVITNSTCTNCTLSGGSIALGTVSGSGGTLQFSTDGGTSWSSTLPVYDQDGPVQIIYASVFSSSGCRSEISLVGSTSPSTCVTPSAPVGTLAITNSTCTNCTLSGGTIALGTVNGTGGTLQFSTNNGTTWSAALPTYDQDGPAQTIHASVLSANGCRSAMTLVGTTVPGVCTPANAGADQTVDCYSTGTATMAATGTGTWTIGAGSAGTATITAPTSPTTTVTNFSASGTYNMVWTTTQGCTDIAVITANNNCACPITNNTITQPSPASSCTPYAGTTIVGLAASPGGGTYLWEVNMGSGFVAAPGTNNTQNYTTGALSAGSYIYQRKYTSTSGVICSTTSNSVTITVNATPVAPTGTLAITNSTCTNCTLSGGTIALGTVTGTGGTLQFSTDGGATWSSALPVYDQDGPAQTIYASVLSASGCRSAMTLVGTTVPGTCTTPAAPTGTLAITNSTCTNCILSGGTIALGTVTGTGGTLQFSTDAGTTWSSTLPTYDQDGPVQIIYASVLSSTGCRSGISLVGSTSPGSCVTPSAPVGMLAITNSTCTNCMLSGGSIALGTVSGSGGTLQFSTDGGATWSTTLPVYDQDGPAQTIYASVLSANGCRGAITLVGTTVPGVCTPANAGADQTVDCYSTGTATMSATGTGTWTIGAGSAGTATITAPTSPTTTVTNFSASGTYNMVWTTTQGCTDIAVITANNNCACPITNNTITQPSPASSCTPYAGTTISGLAASPGGGTYLWEVNSGSGFVAAPGTNNTQNYTTGALSAGTYIYQRKYTTTSGVICTTYSNSVTITVNATPAAPVGTLAITNSTCTNCALSGGSIALGTVTGTGGTLQFSTDGGATWSTTLPVYDQDGPAQTIYASVLSANGCRSAMTMVGTTVPGVCTTPVAPTGTLSITNSTCTNCTLSGGTIALGTVSGTSGTLQFSTDGGSTWNTTLPVYDQDGPAQTIYASVLSTNGCRSSNTLVGTTLPGVCTPANAGANQTVDCYSTGTATMAATGTGTWTIGAGSSGTATITSPTSPTTTVTGFSAAGTYNLVWTTSQGCTDIAVITVNNNCVCPITNNTITQPSPASSCTPYAGTTIVGLAASPGGGTYLWEVNSGSGFVAAPGTNTQQNYTTGALTAGTYTFQRKYTTTSGVICSTTSNNVTITVNATPSAPTGTLAITNSTCTNCTLSGGTIALGTVSGTGGTLQFSTDGGATWSSTLPVYDQDGPAQTIYASVLSANGCRSGNTLVGTTSPGNCPVLAAPAVSIIQPTCEVSTGTITVTSPVGTGYSYSINGVDYQSGTLFSNLVPGSYNVTVKNSAGCISSATVAVVNPATGCQGADLAVTKTVNADIPLIGSEVTFTIRVTNNGPADATDIVMRDVLPTGYTLVSAQPTHGTWSAPEWNIIYLRPGSYASIVIRATVNATGPYANTATVDGRQDDPNPGNNSDVAITTPVQPTLVIVNEHIVLCDQETVTGNILANGDRDQLGSILQVTTTPISGPAHGSATMKTNGDFTYTPAVGYTGTDRVVFQVCSPLICRYDTLFMEVFGEVTANAGNDMELCGETSVALLGNAIPAATVKWKFISGPNTPVISWASSTHALAMGLIKGTYLFEYSVTLAACFDADTIRITLHDPPTGTAGPDQVMCSDNDLLISGSSASNYASVSWSHNGRGTLTGKNTLHPIYRAPFDEVGDVILTMEVKPYGEGGCKVVVDQMKITVLPKPVIHCPVQNNFTFTATPGLCGYVIPDTKLDAFDPGGLCDHIFLHHTFSTWGNMQTLKGAFFPVGITEVEWWAEACGSACHSDTCRIVVTVVDEEPPVFVNCPSGNVFTVGLYPGSCEGGSIWSIPVATDNCSVVTVTQTSGPPQGSQLLPGQYTISYEAADASGNTALCAFTLKVVDTESPLLACHPDISVNSDSGSCSWHSTVNSLSPLLAKSNCPGEIAWEVVNPDGSKVQGMNDVSGYLFMAGTSVVKYTLKESANSQSATCSFRVTVTDGEAPVIQCPAPLEVMADAAVCEAEIMLALPVTDNCDPVPAVSYTILGPDNSMSGPFPGSLRKQRFREGNSLVMWTVTDRSGNLSSCIQQVTVTIHAEHLKPFAGDDAVICEGTPYELSGAAALSGLNLKWESNGTGSFSNPALLHPVYTPSLADILNGRVILILTASSGCAEASDYLVLEITGYPEVDAGPDQSVCAGDGIQILETSAENVASVGWTTNGKGTLSSSNMLQPSYSPAEGEVGEIRFILTGRGFGGCSEVTVADTLLVILREPLQVIASEDRSILYNTATFLTTAVTGGSGLYHYNWEPSDKVMTANTNNTETRPLTSDTEFIITVTDDVTGCSGSDTVNITVKTDIDDLLIIYNAISTNGDGVNDVWLIDGIDLFPDNEAMIFNRWGDKINEFRQYGQNGVFWDGTNKNGKKVPDGTYYYVLKIKDVKSFTGWIQVKSSF